MPRRRLHFQQANSVTDLLVGIAEQAHDALKGKQLSQTEVGSLIGLYGSSKKLGGLARQLQELTDKSSMAGTLPVVAEITPQQHKALENFFDELTSFDIGLSRLGYMTIDIYYPGLSKDILSAIGTDIDFVGYYNERIVPAYGLNKRNVPLGFLDLIETINSDFGYEPVLAQQLAFDVADRGFGPFTSICLPEMEHLYAGLLRCQESIGAIIRENWSFRDVIEHREKVISFTIQGEVTHVKNQYNISGGQQGAVGDKAQAHDFTMISQHAPQSIDLQALSVELSRLRTEAKKAASEPEHDIAVGSLAAAEAAAKKGDEGQTLTHLKAAGSWALDVATKIGTVLAAEVLKHQIGLK